MCRLLFIASHRDVELGHFPSRLLTSAPLRTQSFGLEESVAVLVDAYLTGESVSLVEALTDVCSDVEMRTPFEQNLMLATLDEAAEFFERGPTKVRRLKQRANLGINWVEPEVLLDFLATDRLEVVALNGRIAQ